MNAAPRYFIVAASALPEVYITAINRRISNLHVNNDVTVW